jgi:hypothetical protein
MYKLLPLLLLITSLLFAKNPKPYAALGDVLYNNASAVASLESIDTFNHYDFELEIYAEDIARTKEMGFLLEEGDLSVNKKEYLNSLRKLSKSYDKFKRAAYMNYKISMKEKNYKLFTQMVNNKLINNKKNKAEIMEFYHKNAEYIDVSSGFIHDVLEEEKRIRDEKRAKSKKYKTKKMLEEEKIKRVRKNDKLEEEAKEKKLEAEVMKKKLEIRETQKRELAN